MESGVPDALETRRDGAFHLRRPARLQGAGLFFSLFVPFCGHSVSEGPRMTKNEICLCGLAAVRARFERDAGSVVRLFFDEPTGRKIGALCKALAAARKVYRCVPPAELEKISGSLHHGGIVAVVSAPKLRAPTAVDIRAWAAQRAPLLVLDRIGNAHNLGAIARTAAFFGVEHLVIPAHPAAALPNVAAHRVAEGGLEHVTVWRVPELAAFCRELAAAGYEVVGAAAGSAELRREIGVRRQDSGRRQPVALVLGNEEHGLAPEVAAACTRRVTIGGSGRVESLNVSAAAAVLIHDLLVGASRASSADEKHLRARHTRP
jgi:TrmH RNA methyltransferase